MSYRTTCLLASLLALLVTAAPSPSQEADRNARFGLPSPAKADPRQREDYLIARPQYVLSYNAEKRTPNWVSWGLSKADIGPAARAPFEPDPDLPPRMARVTPRVYDRSGFDRGHMCPAHDRSRSAETIRATFYMTNMVPQSPASNQKGWARLEEYCRALARRGHELHVVCGPHGVGGTGREGRKEEIGPANLKVTVPHKLWKVVVVLPREGAQPRRNTRVIAVVMPNDQTVDFDWAKYRVTVRQVERLTGYTFFRNVPEEVAGVLKDQVDDVEVRVPARRPKGGTGGGRPPGRVGKGHGQGSPAAGQLPAYRAGCVIGNHRSKKYHVPGGAFYERAKGSKNAVFFRTAEDAREAGYTPSSR